MFRQRLRKRIGRLKYYIWHRSLLIEETVSYAGAANASLRERLVAIERAWSALQSI